MNYDIAVVGGGPGGYVAAIRAAQLGAKVLLVEKDKLGGVCLNRGCIPTKTLLKSAEKWQDLRRCAEFGLRAENIGFDYGVVMARTDQVVSQLQAGIRQLVESNNITLAYGQGILAGKNQLNVMNCGETIPYDARKIILATGAIPMGLPILCGDLPDVIDSNELLSMTSLPRSMIVVGAGAVGVELATIYQSFGCEVTIVEMAPTILPNIDGDLIKRMSLILRKQGIKILTNAKVMDMRQETGGIVIVVEDNKGVQEILVEKVLVATGRQPMVEGLRLEAAGVAHSQKGIQVNEKMETSVEAIYAIGDVTGRYMWAHVASAEGMVAAENAMGGNAVMDYNSVPSCIFTSPEIAVVGITEQEALSDGKKIKVSRFNFAANGKAVSMGEPQGMLKVIADAVSSKVLGMHILGAHASDLIMEGAIAIRNGLSVMDIARTIHPHPSLSETVMESVQGIGGESIHQVRLKVTGRD